MGSLFVFEGPDEVGKTTIVEAVEKSLCSEGKNYVRLSFPGREPNTLGAHIYKLHHAPESYAINQMTPLSLQTLHVAAHADIVERQIIPLLEKGTSILLDRYWWSTWVYGSVSGISESHLDALLALEKSFWGSFLPTTLFLINRTHNNSDCKLVEAYNKLASKEENSYQIIRLKNDGTINDITKKIISYI